MTKEEIVKILKESVCKVVFTRKCDGADRTMICTLNDSVFLEPVVESKNDKPKRPDNPDVVGVWDLESGGWRSFRVDSVKSFDIVKEHNYF